MIVLETESGHRVLIIQPENLARLKQGDPITLDNMKLMICYEDLSQDLLMKKAQDGTLGAYLTRGWSDHPDDGQAPVRIWTNRKPDSV